MGTKYEGSIKQAVDNVLKVWIDSHKTVVIFTIDQLVDVLGLHNKRVRVSEIIIRYMNVNAIFSRMEGKKAVYTITNPQLIGHFSRREKLHTIIHGPVKRIEPPIDWLDKEVSYIQLGEAMYKTMKVMKQKIESLETDFHDSKSKEFEDVKKYKEIIAEKDKSIDALTKTVELLRNKVGTFKMSELAPELSKINLIL